MDSLCIEIQERFVDYVDRSLSFTEREGIQKHISSCSLCSRALDTNQGLINVCSQMGDDPLPTGFNSRFKERLHNIPPVTPPARSGGHYKGHGQWRRAWSVFPGLQIVGILALAGLAFLLFLTPAYFRTTTEQPEAPETVSLYKAGGVPVHIDLNQDAVIRIWFDARHPVEKARFYIELPEGVVMLDKGQMVVMRQLQWEGDLQEGRNLIPLKVRGVKRGQWRVTASIEKGVVRKEQFIDLRVDGV